MAKRSRQGEKSFRPKRNTTDFEAIVMVSPDAMIIVDGEGHVQFVNPAAESLFNIPASELLGTTLGFPVGVDKPVELFIMRGYRSYVTTEMRLVGITWAGQPCYLVSFRDLTDRIIAEHALREPYDKLEAIVRERAFESPDPEGLLLRDADERRRAEDEREITSGFLRLVNESRNTDDLLKAAALFFRQRSGCDVVGIRLKVGEDYPYYIARGFTPEFLETENHLCARTRDGKILYDERGAPVYECICGNVICGRFNPSMPFYTAKGSFWTNSTSELISVYTDEDLLARVRGRCVENFESVAVVRVQVCGQTLGLVHINDKRKGMFSPDIMVLWERLADYLAVALAKFQAEESLRESQNRLILAHQVARIGTFELDVRTGVNRWTPELELLYGLRAGGFPRTQEAWARLVHPEDRAETVRKVLEAPAKGIFEGEWRVTWPDGTIHWLYGKAHVYKDDSGKPLKMIGINIDITRRKKMEEELRRSRLDLELEVQERTRELRESEASLAKAQELAHIGSWELDVASGKIDRSAESYRIFGVAPENSRIDYADFIDFIVPADRERVDDTIKSTIKNSQPYTITYDIRRKDGTIRTLLSHGEAMCNTSGGAARICGTNQDITDRKLAEEELRESAASLAMSQHIAHLGSWEYDIKNDRAVLSDEVYNIFGIRREEFVGGLDAYIGRVHPDDRDRVRAIEGRVTHEHTSENYDYRIVRPDGSIRYIHNVSGPVYDEKGEVSRLRGVIQDITERKLDEEAFRESEEKFRNIVDTASEGIWELDRETRIVFVNSQIARMLGYSPKEIVGRFAHEFVDANYVKIAKSVYSNRKSGLKGNVDIKFRKKDGSEVWARISSSPRFKDGVFDGVLEMLTDVTNDKHVSIKMGWLASFPMLNPDPIIELTRYGQISYSNPSADMLFPDLRTARQDHPYLEGIETIFAELHRVGTVVAPREVWIGPSCYEQSFSYHAETDSLRIYGRDITMRKRAEEAMSDAKAQAELYVDLMGHDINNLNQVALGYLELADSLIRSGVKLDENNRELIEKPTESLNSSSKLIEKVIKLRKIKTKGLRLDPVDVCQVLDRISGRYSHYNGRSVTIKYNPPAECMVMANELMDEIFINLIENSIKHSSKDKPLVIDVLQSTVCEAGKEYSRISIEDNGPGISDEIKEKIFGRFSRGETKAKGKGLGLYLIKSLVEDFYGKVWVEDRVHGDHTQGSRFVVMLPAAEK